MNDKWEKLNRMSVVISTERSVSLSDKEIGENLKLSHKENRWKTFYSAIHSLEIGCSYPLLTELNELCTSCADENNLRLLEAIEKKQKMLDTVMLLLSTEQEFKTKWLTEKAFKTPHTLFECLRQELMRDDSSEADITAVASGLMQLTEISSEHAIYIFEHLRYSNITQQIMTKLFSVLSEKGWEAFAGSNIFSGVEPKKIAFWSNCVKNLDWQEISKHALPMICAWNKYINACIEKKHFSESLYNAFTDCLITIYYYTYTPQKCLNDLERAIGRCENKMCDWYESITQQRYVFSACLSDIAVLIYSFLNYEKESDSENDAFVHLKTKILHLLRQYRFLWDTDIPQSNIQKEIKKLKELIHM